MSWDLTSPVTADTRPTTWPDDHPHHNCDDRENFDGRDRGDVDVCDCVNDCDDCVHDGGLEDNCNDAVNVDDDDGDKQTNGRTD